MRTITIEVKEIQDIFPSKEIKRRKCIDPTSTLTKGKYYDTVLRKDQWRPGPFTYSHDDAWRDMIGVINDNGQYIEVKLERFK